MPMAIVSFGTPVFENRPSRKAEFICDNFEQADSMARAVTEVFTGEDKPAGYFLLDKRHTRIGFVASDFWISVEPASQVKNLSYEELEWLRAFADEHGRQWKSKLRQQWFNSKEVGIARALRNRTTFNLSKFKFPEA